MDEDSTGGDGLEPSEGCCESDESDDSDGFIPESDHGPAIPDCDPWDLDSCGPGQKCTGYSPSPNGLWETTRCVPIVEDPKSVGEACSYEGAFEDGFDDCELGSVCWDVMLLQGKDVGTCVPICVGSVNAPGCADDENYLCNLYKAAIGLCLPRCDPTATDCPLGCTCLHAGGQGFFCLPNNSGGVGDYGTECQYSNSCNLGLFCGPGDLVAGCDDSQNCCNYFCDLGEPSLCAQVEAECIPFYEEGTAPPGYEHVGVCATGE